MLYGRWLACSTIMLALVQVACGVQVTCSGGGPESEIGSVTTQMEAAKDASVSVKFSINGGEVDPLTIIPGPVKAFTQTHQVTDGSGKSARVTVNVVDAPDGLSYRSEVLPKEGRLTNIPTIISAEQWLSVPRAGSIKCSASASNMLLSADASIEETRGKSAEEYVALTDYNCKATATSRYLTADQTAAYGSGGSIKIYNHARELSMVFGIETSILGISGTAASFQDLHASSSSGTSTKSAQDEHVSGAFTSTSRCGSKTLTRTSTYGTEYDLIMSAAKGSAPKGNLAYYIDPDMATGAIQGAVNDAKSGDTINVASGEYSEDININKAVALIGSGDPTARSFILSSPLASGFGGITAPKVNVMPGAKIQDGIYLVSSGGTVNVGAGKYIEDISIDKELTLIGSGNPTAKSFSLDGALIGDGSGGITAPVVYVNSGSKIQDGVTLSSSILNVGPGYFEENINIDKPITIKGSGKSLTGIDGRESGSVFTIAPGVRVSLSDMAIMGGKAINGGGIFNSGSLAVSNCIISSNWADYGGGIHNAAGASLVVTGSTISSNEASVGAGIDNEGTATLQGRSIISGNYADYGSGGGIHNAAGASLVVTGSTISSNEASVGAGIDNEGTAALQGGSIISGNYADYGSGGGIHNADGATVTATGCTISSNSATFGGGVNNEGIAALQGLCTVVGNLADYGGGIYSAPEATTTVMTSTISRNTAMFDGGGVFSDCSILNMYGIKIQDNSPNDIVEY